MRDAIATIAHCAWPAASCGSTKVWKAHSKVLCLVCVKGLKLSKNGKDGEMSMIVHALAAV